MTPFSAPSAGAAPPRPQGPPAAAGVPRPVMGSYGNNLAAAVRVAPSSTPRVQPPIARPRMPLAPHAQGPPIAGAPRPMVTPGGAPMSAPSPTPRMQAPRAPGIPPNTRAVGAAVPSASARPHMPLSQPTHRAPAAANPAAPSLGKRPPTTTGPAPVPAAKRHAPIPRPQGAAPTGGVPLHAGAPSPSQHAQGAPTAVNATPSRPSPSQQLPNLSYIGVYRDPSKGWMARAMDLKRRVARSIGPFDDPHLAALAHDRAAIACAGRGVARGAPLNFEAAFYRVETAFLHRWEGDVCEALEKGEYEKVYARFLRAGYKAALNIEDGDDGGERIADGVDAHADELIASCVGDAQFFWDDVEDFFLCRAAEIGEEALKGKEDGRDDGGKLLRNRFVEMHRNKSLCPEWRHKNRLEKLRMMTLQKQQHDNIQMQQQQQQHQIHTQQQQQHQIHTQQQQQQIQQRQQQIQMQQQQQQQQIPMKPEQQQHVQQHQQQHQVQMQQQRQQQIQQRQQHFQQQMMMQNQRQQHMMMAQQQQQYLDDDATVQVKQELS